MCIQLFRAIAFALLVAGAPAVTVVLYPFELPAAESDVLAPERANATSDLQPIHFPNRLECTDPHARQPNSVIDPANSLKRAGRSICPVAQADVNPNVSRQCGPCYQSGGSCVRDCTQCCPQEDITLPCPGRCGPPPAPSFTIEATVTWRRNPDLPTFRPPTPEWHYSGPLGTVQTSITVQSVSGFSGPVNITVSCCNDGTANPMIPSGAIESVTVSVPRDGQATFVSKVDLVRQGNDSCPETAHTCAYYIWPRYGDDFLVTVTATSAAFTPPPYGFPFSIWPGAGVTDTTCTGSNCPDGPVCSDRYSEEIPLALMAKQLASTPMPLTFTIFGKNVLLLSATNPIVWTIEWTIEDSPNLSWDQTSIALYNGAQTEAQILSFIACGQDPLPLLDVVNGQPSQTVSLKPIGDSHTLIYRRRFCASDAPWGCQSYAWHDVAIFGAEAFWSIASGKKMTLTVRDCPGCTPVCVLCIDIPLLTGFVPPYIPFPPRGNP
jgi:hypothetical protein